MSQSDIARWADLLDQRNADIAGRPVYRYLLKGDPPATDLSYAELRAKAGSLALQLRERYPAGTHLMLLFEPGLDFCLSFWACLLAGIVAVPCYPPADPRLRERFMSLAKDAGAKGVLTTAGIKRLITLARWFMSSLRKLDWIAIDELPLVTGDLPAPAAPDSLALLQYTSGSTGTPRGVMLSHGNLWQNLLCLEGARQSSGPRSGDSDSLISWLPLYHDMGLMTGVVYPVFLGTHSVLFSPLHFLQKPARWLRGVSEYQSTLSAAPNFAYEFCLRRIRDDQLEGLDLSSWDATLNGAEAIRPSTVRAFSDRFAPQGLRPNVIYPCYGLAESTVFVTGNQRGGPPIIGSFSKSGLLAHRVAEPAGPDDLQELVSCGRSFGDTEIRIVAPETCRLCSPDTVGEIWVRGGSVGQGYWQQPEPTREIFQARIAPSTPASTDDRQVVSSLSASENWLRTGDLGFFRDQWLFITGRIKDLIILQGQNYAPQTFEALAEGAHDAVRTGCVAAFGAGEPEGLVMLVEIKPAATDSPSEIIMAIRAKIGEAAGVPVQDIKLVAKATLPKTSSGKLRRRSCREMYLSGKLKAWKK